MNWYKGNIAEAVAESKARNAVFVVYVEGKDEATEKLTTFLNEGQMRQKLESNDFVAIKIESESQAYMQFASIYQMVPVPSIFFIGKSGTPLEIATGVVGSASELEQKIDNVLKVSGKGASPSAGSSVTSAFIGAEQASSVQSETQSTKEGTEKEKEDVICDGEICYKKPKENTEVAQETKLENEKVPKEGGSAAASTPDDDEEQRLAKTRKYLEQKRRERIEEEKRQEKERELRRRREGKDMQNFLQFQKEQELKELKENLRRGRLEEQAARERIRAQIAADRAECARRFGTGVEVPTPPPAPTASTSAPRPSTNSAPDMTRLQFRFASGESKTHSFKCTDTLGDVRDFVRCELLPATGIKDFILATTYPKREFDVEHNTKTLTELELYPSAVILIIGKESVNPATIIARSGGLFNMLSTVFWTLLSPVFALVSYVKGAWGGNGRNNANATTVAAHKRANEEQSVQQEASKRRNLDNFTSGAGPSATAADDRSDNGNGEQRTRNRYVGGSNIHRLTDNRKDSDDENATWNGNSTQQQ